MARPVLENWCALCGSLRAHLQTGIKVAEIMNDRMNHARMIGIIALVCLSIACILGMDLFFVLVIVYRAGWLNSSLALAGMGVAATLLALAQCYIIGRALTARYPEQTSSMLRYSKTHMLKIVAASILVLVALRFAVGAYLG